MNNDIKRLFILSPSLTCIILVFMHIHSSLHSTSWLANYPAINWQAIRHKIKRKKTENIIHKLEQDLIQHHCIFKFPGFLMAQSKEWSVQMQSQKNLTKSCLLYVLMHLPNIAFFVVHVKNS